MYRVLYRKWRPQTFEEVYGQPHITATLKNELVSGRVAHAYLFTGSRGTGKTTCAKILSKAVNCLSPHDGDPCNECEICRGIDNGSVLDVIEIDAASNNGVDNIRDLRDEANFTPVKAKYRVYIIDEVHMLSTGAFNALLKILEEPWEKTLFVLVSERPDLLLPTILSRTQEVVVPRLTDEEVRAELERRGERDPEKIRTFTRLAAGDLIELEHLLRGEGDELRKDDFEFFCSLMRLSYNDKHLELMAWAEEVAQLSREQQRAFLTNAVRLLRESYLLHAGLGEISCLWGEEAKFCRNFAPFIGNQNIESLVAEAESAMAQIRQNGNPTIVFTHFALSVSKMIKKL